MAATRPQHELRVSLLEEARGGGDRGSLNERRQVSFEDSDGSSNEGAAHRDEHEHDWRPWVAAPSTLWLMPVPMIFMMQSMLLSTLLPEIQANWFTKCDLKAVDAACKPDYESAQAVGGVVHSIQNLFAFFSAALIGRLSDVWGRRRVLMFGVAIACLPTAALLVTNTGSASIFFGTTILTGLLGVGSTPTFLTSVSNAYVADVYAPEARSSQFGLIMASSTGSMILNPLFGILTNNLSLQMVYTVCLSLSAGLLLYIWLVLPESLPPSRRNRFSCGRTMNPLSPLRLLGQSQVLRWISFVYFLGCAAELGVKEIALVYVDDVLDLQGAAARDFNRLLFCVIGGTMMISAVVVLRALLYIKLRPSTLFAIGQANNAVHIGVYILLGYLPHKWVILSNAVPTGFIVVSSVAATSLISSNMGPQEQGFAFGTLSAVGGIADILSPLLYSELFSYFGKRYGLPEVPFGLGVLFALASAVVTVAGPLRSLDRRAKRMLAPSHSVLYNGEEEDEQDRVEAEDSSQLAVDGA